ncbi:hypothetical protein SAMN05216266_107197 [Amycolatopsis marina]|uniref:Acetyltransferase involved in cellulose biosynthesis, CelD/BcsL family n=1 Tax=Amycolatopsis marina TaxID=490629 RepID=A0A1I0ZU07_9PSEU|nr:hypothetical protein [Amycolatopsis marina]SFB27818.1 hypothetical protein SAMN05216266_107197 [Amycolatopsis marina]
MNVDIVDPRTDREPEGWRDFRRRANLPPVWDYQLLGTEAWLSRNPPVLAVLHNGTRVVGACSVMVCRTFRGRTFAPSPSGRRTRLRPVWAEVYLPLLSGYPAGVFDRSVDAAARKAALRLFERELVRFLGIGTVGVVYRAMTPEVGLAAGGGGRVTREIDPTAVMRNRWSSFADWLDTLSPRVRAAIERLDADDTVQVTSGAQRTDLDGRELAVLLNEHRARQDARAWAEGQRSRVGGLHLDTRSPVAAAYLDTFVRRRDVVTTVYRDRNGGLLAFNTMIDHPVSSAVHHWAAVPAGSGGRGDLYIDAYARCVRHMIEHGRAELTAGRTLLDVKGELGFGTRSLTSVAVPRPVMGR